MKVPPCDIASSDMSFVGVLLEIFGKRGRDDLGDKVTQRERERGRKWNHDVGACVSAATTHRQRAGFVQHNEIVVNIDYIDGMI